MIETFGRKNFKHLNGENNTRSSGPCSKHLGTVGYNGLAFVKDSNEAIRK